MSAFGTRSRVIASSPLDAAGVGRTTCPSVTCPTIGVPSRSVRVARTDTPARPAASQSGGVMVSSATGSPQVVGEAGGDGARRAGTHLDDAGAGLVGDVVGDPSDVPSVRGDEAARVGAHAGVERLVHRDGPHM